MDQIEFSKLKAARHTVKVPLKFEENGGNATTKQVAVAYRGRTLTETQENDDEMQDSTDKRATLIKQLAAIVIEFPQVVDNGTPVQSAPEVFEAMDTYFLWRIRQAITDDVQGN